MTAVIARAEPITAWTIDAVHPGDRVPLTEMFDRCSVDTVVHRFFGLVRQFPRRYLDEVLAGAPERHDAVVARAADGAVIGLGSVGSGDGVAELGVLVEDAWQRQGVGTALVDALIARARCRSVTRIAAGVLPGRDDVLSGLDRRLPKHRVRYQRDATTHVYELI
jgi:GNAT superfamily N-acetyltransferase